jgi:hypothetical protein
MGPDQIYVRTAQVRTLVSVELPALNGLSALLNAVTSALSGVTSVLNSVLALDLKVVGNMLACVLVCVDDDVTDIDVLPPPVRLDIGLDVGHGQSRVTDFRCDAAEQSLTTSTRTALADIRIGKMGATAESAKASAFSSSTLPVPGVVPVIDIGKMKCTRVLLGLIPVCHENTRQAFFGGGLGLSAEVPLVANTATQQFVNPPKLDQAPVYQAISSQNIVSTLQSTLGGANLLHPIAPSSAAESPALGTLLTGLTNALSGVIGVLRTVVANLLSPLLDPLLNTLLKGLGIDLAQTEVAGRLSCAGSVELVY